MEMKDHIMRIAYFCFIIGVLAGITGMGLGIHMAASEDHSLAPAHAHLNLLGWVTMMLYGLYHRYAPDPGRWLNWLQVSCGAAGFPVFTAALAHYLATGNTQVIAHAWIGALLTLVGMILFLAVLIRDAGLVGTAFRRKQHQNDVWSG
jgi:hypothetical protein